MVKHSMISRIARWENIAEENHELSGISRDTSNKNPSTANSHAQLFIWNLSDKMLCRFFYLTLILDKINSWLIKQIEIYVNPMNQHRQSKWRWKIY